MTEAELRSKLTELYEIGKEVQWLVSRGNINEAHYLRLRRDKLDEEIVNGCIRKS